MGNAPLVNQLLWPRKCDDFIGQSKSQGPSVQYGSSNHTDHGDKDGGRVASERKSVADASRARHAGRKGINPFIFVGTGFTDSVQ